MIRIVSVTKYMDMKKIIALFLMMLGRNESFVYIYMPIST